MNKAELEAALLEANEKLAANNPVTQTSQTNGTNVFNCNLETNEVAQFVSFAPRIPDGLADLTETTGVCIATAADIALCRAKASKSNPITKPKSEFAGKRVLNFNLPFEVVCANGKTLRQLVNCNGRTVESGTQYNVTKLIEPNEGNPAKPYNKFILS